MTLLSLPAATVEALGTTITSDVDPTGFTIEFAFTAIDGAHSFSAGSWVGSATALSNGDYRSTALTPTIGTSGADVTLTAGTKYGIYARIGATGETPVIGPERLGYVRLDDT